MTLLENFLPRFQAATTLDPSGKSVKCLRRNKDVILSPEERVRQRVLHWLLKVRQWPASRISVEEPIQFVDRSRGRADIVLRANDDYATARIVVECKAGGILLGEDVARQAQAYARKLRASEIWLTNGEEHRFFLKSDRGEWVQKPASVILAASAPPSTSPSPPTRRLTGRRLEAYLARFPHLRECTGTLPSAAILACHRLMFAEPPFYSLPWSHRGLHILEDRGLSELSVKVPGGAWHSIYRMFLVATEGRVQTAGIGLNNYGGPDGLIVCVAFLKRERTHHALQLPVRDYFEFNATGLD